MRNSSIESILPLLQVQNQVSNSKKTTRTNSSYLDLLNLSLQNKPVQYTPVKPEISNKTATQAEIEMLAAKYNPKNMTNQEYNAFVNDLVKNGLLSADEAKAVYGEHRAHYYWEYSDGKHSSCGTYGKLMDKNSYAEEDLHIHTLLDANNNAVYWVKCQKLQSMNPFEIQSFEKLANIMERMEKYCSDKAPSTDADFGKTDAIEVNGMYYGPDYCYDWVTGTISPRVDFSIKTTDKAVSIAEAKRMGLGVGHHTDLTKTELRTLVDVATNASYNAWVKQKDIRDRR